MSKIIHFPPSTSLRPEQALGTCAKIGWHQFLGMGITTDGHFEIVNSDMSAERALWLIKWAERWAMGLDEAEKMGESA
jgi:hypothetical protein